MNVEILAESGCADRSCPTVYRAEDGTILVQGFIPTADATERIALPDGEQIVAVPAELLQAAVAALTQT